MSTRALPCTTPEGEVSAYRAGRRFGGDLSDAALRLLTDAERDELGVILTRRGLLLPLSLAAPLPYDPDPDALHDDHDRYL